MFGLGSEIGHFFFKRNGRRAVCYIEKRKSLDRQKVYIHVEVQQQKKHQLKIGHISSLLLRDGMIRVAYLGSGNFDPYISDLAFY